MENILRPDNLTAIAEATAKATDYVIPSVDQILAAGVSPDQVNRSLFWDGQSMNPGAIFPQQFNHLYYNISFLWPQFDITGPIVNRTHTCSLIQGTFLYLPNIPANAVFAALFGLAMLIVIPISIRYRTWGFLVGMIGGLICEVAGYVGRIEIAKNDFSSDPFYAYIICLTIGPAFLSFSIYTCLARIVIVYGKDLSRFKPRTYTYIFVVCDFIALVLQGAGGGLAATADSYDNAQTGINIMIAGLAFQVFSLTVFVVLCAEYAFRVFRRRSQMDPTYAVFRSSWKFKAFQIALTLATIVIFARSAFRVAELREGFGSRLANEEVTFMVLEAAMILIAVIALTAFHPGLVFGQLWREVSMVIKGSKSSVVEKQNSATGYVSSDNSLTPGYQRGHEV